MKVLIVRTYPNIIDPNQYNVQEIGLAKALVRAGHICDVVLYNGKNQDVVEEMPVICKKDVLSIKVYRLHGYQILKNGIFPSLKKIVSGYDVIQVHEYDQISSWRYYAWSKKPVVIYHGPYFHPFNQGYNLKCKIFDAVFLGIKHNKKVVCMTKSHAAAEFLKKKHFKNVIPIGVGVNPETFNNIEREDYDINVPKDKFNLLYVGKIEERRNPHFLVEVMNAMCRRYDDINCIVIGNGNKEDVDCFCRETDLLMKQGKLQYYSSASQSQLAEVYKKSQLMIFPTHYDIFGMVLLEALYFDLPVISTHNGGADMLLRHNENSFVMEDMDLRKWCDVIQNLHDNYAEYGRIKSSIEKMDKNLLFWDGLVPRFIQGYEMAYSMGVNYEK